ncbi:ABC transporter ATP-binding protein [Anaerococcus provencensis]|uniref:ABC transporter ATP-binding protein n=1 Tax=Anaerococcus provencensis TaxID=938293 RepID=UPI00030AC706|nr:ABC transporter ATP-binding protein [Anaerococcus provencensis]
MIKNSTFKIFKIIKSYGQYFFILSFVLEIISALIFPLSLLLMEKFVNTSIDYFLTRGNLNLLIRYLLLFLITFFLVSNFDLFTNRVDIHLQRNIKKNISSEITDKFYNITYECFEDSNFNNTLKRMQNNPDEKIFDIYKSYMSIIKSLISIVSVNIIISKISPIFSLTYSILIAVICYFDFMAMNEMNTMFNNQSYSERESDYFKKLLSDKHSLVDLRVYKAINFIYEKFSKANKDKIDERISTSIKNQKYYIASNILISIWVISILYMVYKNIMDAYINIGLFVAVITSIDQILSLSENISYDFSFISQNILNLEHFEKFMSQKEEDDKVSQSKIDPSFIEFRNVSFTYPNTKDKVLDNISFKIDMDKTLALVGKNGSGKSTIIKLILKLYKADSGEILIGNRTIDDISRSQLQDLFSVVFQDFSKYEITVRENVALSDISKIDDDMKIRNCLDSFKLSELGNLDQNLGKIREDGIDLSFGQWQKLALARAIFKKAPFTIFDEPTSSLDPISENKMYENLHILSSTHGSVFISHRLASCKMCDKIILIDNGKVKEYGSHKDLIYQNGLYKKMYEEQSSWYGESDRNV